MNQLLNDVYPSADELLPRSMLGILPAALVVEITERYESLGTKYLSDKFWPDGRQINSMLFTDRIVNCREKVIDAVFCILGQIFKDLNHSDNQPDDALYSMLEALIAVYSICVSMEEGERYTNVSIDT